MNVVKVNGKISNDEKEVVLLFDYMLKQWIMDTTVMKFYNKAKKQGWTQLTEYINSDNIVCGGVFIAPAHAVTIRSSEKRKMTEKQMSNLSLDEDE